MQTVMSHSFSQVPKVQIPRSVFDRSHGFKTSFNVGYLVPFLVDEVLPGDTFRVNATLFARLTTPLKPIMDNMFLETFYFFVPNRLVWTHWANLMGEMEGIVVGSETAYTVPVVTAHTIGIETLQDYMGLPYNKSVSYCAFPTRAYNLIWNEWFRDENLQTKATVDKGEGPDNSANYVLRKRGKRHDYFTSCLPWPQKGPGVSIPLGTSAPVIGDGKAMGLTDIGSFDNRGLAEIRQTNVVSTIQKFLVADTHAIDQNVGASLSTFDTVTADTTHLYATGLTKDANHSHVFADLTSATAATINTLRQAFQLQRLYERDARGGTRYTELIRTHFGVTNPDFRLQRPEYLGGGSQRININPVQQTAPFDAEGSSSTVGNLGAFGLVTGQSGFTKSFTEHGIIIGLLNVRGDITYQQGLNKMWTRSTRFDFYWPALSNIGEQAVYNKEIYYQNTSDDALVFGYQERYAEYRYKPSRITGQLRSTYSTPLDMWHLSEKFDSLPTLSDQFIQDSLATPLQRCIVVSSPHFILDSYIEMHCARPMPVYAVPGMIDHF